MNSLEFSVAFIMFAPVIATMALLIALFIADYQYKKESAYMDILIRRCREKKGNDCVVQIIQIAKDCGFGRKYIIKSLEKELEN